MEAKDTPGPPKSLCYSRFTRPTPLQIAGYTYVTPDNISCATDNMNKDKLTRKMFEVQLVVPFNRKRTYPGQKSAYGPSYWL